MLCRRGRLLGVLGCGGGGEVLVGVGGRLVGVLGVLGGWWWWWALAVSAKGV